MVVLEESLTMKIKRYPGKAVIDDPAWLEMDIPPHARGQQYEANWIDTQKNLSNSSSASNSWDKYSTKLEGSVSSRLGQYQSLLEEIRKDNNEDIYAIPKKIKTNGSIRLKYHSDNILSRINSKSKADMERPPREYFLPSQSVHRDQIKEPPVPKPRVKLPIQNGQQEKFKTVLEDLQRQMKKSVRFDEVSTDIDQEIEKREQSEDNSLVRVIVNPTHELLERIELNISNDNEENGRVSEWVDTQNQYLSDQTSDTGGKDLHRNDSGYYERSKKIRQRLPPKHIYPPSASSSESSITPSENNSAELDVENFQNNEDEEDDYNDYDEVYSLYKEGVVPAYVSSPLRVPKPVDKTTQATPTSPMRRSGDSNDFLIPRPKLIVPVHTYAVRRRRTGNLNKHDSVSSCNYVSASERDSETMKLVPQKGMMILLLLFIVLRSIYIG